MRVNRKKFHPMLETLARLWRYPVKSILAEQPKRLDLGLGGIAGDRRYAIHNVHVGLRSQAAPEGGNSRCRPDRRAAQHRARAPQHGAYEEGLGGGGPRSGRAENHRRRSSTNIGRSTKTTSRPTRVICRIIAATCFTCGPKKRHFAAD